MPTNLIGSISDAFQNILSNYPLIASFLCAELFFLLAKSSDIIRICKSDSQRTEKERLQIKHGLRKSLLLEVFIFVPASVILFRLIIFPLIYDRLLLIKQDVIFWYSFIGIVAYGFPFAAIREFIKRMALKTLREFADISIEKSSSKKG